MKQVRKKDGQLQDFDRMKLYQSMVAAGLTEVEANAIADQIKQKVIDALEIKHPEVMERYKTYRRPA